MNEDYSLGYEDGFKAGQEDMEKQEKALAQPEHSCPECVFGVCHCKPLAQPAVPQGHEQEPVAVIGSGFQLLYCRNDWSKGLKVGDCLYTTPPQQKPMTDEQREDVLDEMLNTHGFEGSDIGLMVDLVINAVEAARGIKE